MAHTDIENAAPVRGIAWFLIEDQAKEKKTLTRSLGVMLKRNELSRSSKNFIRIKERKWM